MMKRVILALFLLFLFCTSKETEKNSAPEQSSGEQIPKDCYQLISIKPASFPPGLMNSWDTLILKKFGFMTEDTVYLWGGAVIDTTKIKIGKFYKILFEKKQTEGLTGVQKLIYSSISIIPCKKE